MGWAGWIRTVEVEPSIPAEGAAARERQVEALLRTGCRCFHLNGTAANALDAVALLSPLIRRYDGVLDVHVPDPDVAALAAAGAHSVTFDAAAVSDPAAVVARVRDAGVPVGIAFTSADGAEAHGADLVLCDGTIVLEDLRRLALALPPGVTLQVEGDITHENARSLYRAGAKLLVVDQPIFQREDLPRAYRRLVQALA